VAWISAKERRFCHIPSCLGALVLFALALLMFSIPVRAEEPSPPQMCVNLGDLTKRTNWTGLQQAGTDATLAVPGEATFRYPDAVAGSGGVGNWSTWYGVRFDVRLDDNRPVDLDVILQTPDAAKSGVAAHAILTGAGWHTVTLPWASFDFPQTFSGFLDDIKEVSIAARSEDQKPAAITFRKAQVIRAETVWLHTDQRGRSVKAGDTAQYTVTVGNCTDGPQAVSLLFQRDGFEAMSAAVEPKTLQLAAGATADVVVRVQVPARVPPGGNETQTLRAVANGVSPASATLSFVTASKLEHPFILHTSTEWDQIRNTAKNVGWAKEAAQSYLTRADHWDVSSPANNGHWLYPSCYPVEDGAMANAVAYQLTSDNHYAAKVRTFLLQLSDPQGGYPKTHKACNQASVQEGEFFQRVAWVYDLTIPSGVYNEADRHQIDATLRLFIGPEASFGGQISNWNVSSQSGALYCSLVLQDLASANHILYGKGALIDQLRQGTLDDGWWYECSISYNVWCATEFSQVAIAMRPWGLDLAHRSFPAAYRPSDVKPPSEELYGMSQARWGPIYHNSITIKRMWDALPPMLDYRGVIFGLNDSAEKPVGGAAMDIAYYLYRDPAYAAVIRHGGDRDLLYAVPDLPKDGPDLSHACAYADNVGVVVLRSQKQNRPQREQIQAVLHYGDHGWFHGHFDQTDLLHLSRYGRSFFNPEMIWYSYPNFMYKFYVQTSVSKNMVVVDQKMQEPTESQRLLFHTGPMMQAMAVQTNARWSNPPYGGMVYNDQPYKTFVDKAFAEGRSVPIPDHAPAYGAVTGYTEPVLQRRLMIVTDDYIVLADYLKAKNEHTFDSLLQMKSFQGLEAAGKKLVRHTGQWNSDPLSSAQFVTDCDWYDVTAPARSSYEFCWGAGGDYPGTNDPGVLKLDVHTLWPIKQQVMLGTPPESDSPHQQVNYAVRGDGKTLAEGKFGAWILGHADMDVPVDGVKQLELQTHSGGAAALFWANARVVTASGKEISLSQLPCRYENTLKPKGPGQDYAGGPIKIIGVTYPLSTPAQPQDRKRPAVVQVDLTGVDAVRFKCILGGDFPTGDETHRRKTVAERVIGKEARFLTVIEPYETDRVIKRAEALNADKLRVEFLDGRVQEIEIHNLQGSGHDIGVQLTEIQSGQPAREEQTRANEK
jgi:hypothetical protein